MGNKALTVCAVALTLTAGRAVEMSYQNGIAGDVAMQIIRDRHPEAASDGAAIVAAGAEINGTFDMSDVQGPDLRHGTR